MKNLWHFHSQPPEDIHKEFSSIPETLRQLLYNRGISSKEEARRFLKPSLDHLHNPMALQDMDKALSIIDQTVKKKGKICVYGDYDADGVCSTTLMYSTLQKITSNVEYYIPDRFSEGYGLNKEAIKKLRQDHKVDLLITVDCGITNNQEVNLAKELGMLVIVTDHHHVPAILPEADAIINPKRQASQYPFKELAGVGVAYKLCQALQNKYQFDYTYDPLEIVALATIADVVALTDENRVLVSFGLEAMRKTKRPGLIAMMENSVIEKKTLTSYHIGFQIAPRINAAGRLDNASLAVELLLSENVAQARPLAAKLGKLNAKRQELTSQVVEACRQQLEKQQEDRIFILGGKEWSSGVVGLAAGRICQEYHRPVIVMEYGHKISRASARSIPAFHMTQALNQMPELFLTFGGHAEAAGFSIANENIPELTKRLKKLANSSITDEDMLPIVNIDAELDLENVDYKLFRAIEYLAPFGHSNPEPVFVAKNRDGHTSKKIGKDKSHLRLAIPTNKGQELTGIGFGLGEHHDVLNEAEKIHLAYHLNENSWQGIKSLQLMIKDIKTSDHGIHYQQSNKRTSIFAYG